MTADALGNPMRLILTGGQAHDMSQAKELLHVLKCDYMIAENAYKRNSLVDIIETGGAKGGQSLTLKPSQSKNTR